MPTPPPDGAPDEALTLARGHVYAFLAAAFADPLGAHFQLALDPARRNIAVAAADLLAAEAPKSFELGPGESPPRQLDLRPVAALLARPRDEIVRDHQDAFGLLLGKAAPPYETEYCRPTLTFYRTQQLADIAGFYRAFHLDLNHEEPSARITSRSNWSSWRA